MFVSRKILILDDEIEICTMLSDFLTDSGYEVRYSTEIEGFLEQMNAFRPHFLIMDKYVHRHDCFSLIGSLRKVPSSQNIPILVITGCTDLEEKVRALELGADDVLIKPIQLIEVKAKLQSLARRASIYQLPTENITYKDIRVVPQSGEVFSGESRLPLTETEFKIFQVLLISKGKAVQREQLVHKTLTARNNNLRTIDVHINSLRTKLGDVGSKIKTLRGRGYMLVD
ncbi:MAG: response regulator transcription factor [Bdellovibrionaceae bacterium]|nr:response regulator transcription factor [Pseudobdellovibrionaceae bacterium]